MKLGMMALYGILFSACSVSMAASTAKTTDIQQRIASAHEKFEQALLNAPEQEVEATMFFTNDMSLEHLQTALRNGPLKVKAFHHGTSSYAGGYALKPGESLDEAIGNYRRDHVSFLKKRMEIEERMIAKETDEKTRKTLFSHRREAEQMVADFDLRGIRVVGMAFHGKAKDLADFKERNSFVRVIELQESGKPQPAIIPSPVHP